MGNGTGQLYESANLMRKKLKKKQNSKRHVFTVVLA
jgi:hypothetical protein